MNSLMGGLQSRGWRQVMKGLELTRKFLPLITISDLDDCEPLGEVLVKGNIPFIEIAYRNDLATEAIRKMSKYPGLCAGAGTVITGKQAEEAVNAGARFLVSPGFAPEVAVYASEHDVPYYPGVVTPTDIIAAVNAGYTDLKFFPAGAYGGIATLKALKGPFPYVRFLPTGGVSKDNYREYLAQDNVFAVGGSFILPGKYVKAKDWEGLLQYIAEL